MKRRICLSLGNYKALCSRPKCFSFACSLQQSPKLYHPHNSAPSIKLTFCYMDNFCLANYKILHYQSNFTDILGFTNLAQLPSAGCFSTIVFSVLYLQILLDRRQALRFFFTMQTLSSLPSNILASPIFGLCSCSSLSV
jgi:hypothetical protein